MRDEMVMTTLGLKFLSNEAKKLVKSAVDLSKKMLTTCLKIPYNAAVYPISCLYGGLKYIYEQTFASASESSSEPKNPEIIGSMQLLRKCSASLLKLVFSSKRDTGTDTKTLNESVSDNEGQHGDKTRNGGQHEPEQIPDITQLGCTESCGNHKTAPLGVSDFSGSDLMWDVPIISAKAKYFTRCLKERNIDKIAVARKVLEEHAINNQMPKTRREYHKMMKEFKNGLEHFSNNAEFRYECNTAASTKLMSNIHEKNEKLESCSDGTSDLYFQRNKNIECVCDPKLIQGKIMRHEIATIGRELRRIHETCSSLLKGLSTLNEHLSKYVSMKETIASLEKDVEEGRRLLKEVEYDRSMMKTKLLALEELITEEQQFLFESSCESGFYETNARTDDELSAFKNVPNLRTSQNP